MDSKLMVALVVLMAISTLPLRMHAQNTTAPNINSTGCGMSKFCASEPASCDPSVSSGCFFVSSESSGGQTFAFQLSGMSTGYIALGLFVNGTEGINETTYVCANNNNSVNFSSNLLNNNNLTANPASSANLTQSSVNGSLIQCTFSATVPNATTMSSSTSFFLSLSNGTFINGTLGSPNAVFTSSNAVDLTAANSTATNNLTTTATTATPPSSDGTLLINRTGCATSKFCASEPASCDPSVSSSCFFFSSESSGGQTFAFQLSGMSTGYIALGLFVAGAEGLNETTYVCASYNNSVLFSSNLLNNNTLTANPASSANLTQSSANMGLIKCTFSATVPNAKTQGLSTSFFLSLLSGPFFNGVLGSPTTVFRSSNAVDFSSPNSTTTNAVTTNTQTTNAPTPSSMSSTANKVQHFLSQALLIGLGGLGLAML